MTNDALTELQSLKSRVDNLEKHLELRNKEVQKILHYAQSVMKPPSSKESLDDYSI